MGKIIGENIYGYAYNDIIEKFKEALKGRVILVLDDIDLLNSRDLFYYLTRSVDVMTISILQNVMWYDNLDDSTKSSYRPEKIFFANYTSEQLKEILMLRAKYGLDHYEEDKLALIGGLVAKNYLGDARVAILALYHAGLEDKWDGNSIKKYTKIASTEVLEYTLTRLDFRQLVILTSLVDQPETNKAYVITREKLLKEYKYNTYSKSTYYKDLKVLSNYGIITFIKKKVNQFYTYEAEVNVPIDSITDIFNKVKQKLTDEGNLF
jgi:Cdc6-like AAA superfamily ATPase